MIQTYTKHITERGTWAVLIHDKQILATTYSKASAEAALEAILPDLRTGQGDGEEAMGLLSVKFIPGSK